MGGNFDSSCRSWAWLFLLRCEQFLTISSGEKCSYLAWRILVEAVAYASAVFKDHEKLVLIDGILSEVLVIVMLNPSQVIMLRTWSSTKPCVRRSRPIMTSYREFGLLNSRMSISEIVRALQKSGKNVYFPIKYFELLYMPWVVVKAWDVPTFSSTNVGNEHWLINVGLSLQVSSRSCSSCRS